MEQEVLVCPFCGAPYRELIPVGTVQVKCRYCAATILVPPRLGGLVRRCPSHPETLTIGLCNDCGESYCDHCLHVLKSEREEEIELYLCSHCLKKRRSRNVRGLLLFSSFWLAFGLLLTALGYKEEGVIGLRGGLFIILVISTPSLLFAFYEKTRRYSTVHEKMDEITRVSVQLTAATEELYRRLLNAYATGYGRLQGEKALERKIGAYVKLGLDREKAIIRVAADEGYLRS